MGSEIATKHCAQLGATHFKELQVMKFAWRNNIGDCHLELGSGGRSI